MSVEIASPAGERTEQVRRDSVEWRLCVFGEQSGEALFSKLLARGVGRLDQTVGIKRQEVANLKLTLTLFVARSVEHSERKAAATDKRLYYAVAHA